MEPFDFIKAGYKAGDPVFSMAHGWGRIADITNHDFALSVEFEKSNECFTSDGRCRTYAISPTLFPNEFVIPASAYERPRPDLKVDEPVLVVDRFGNWRKRHFAGWADDGHLQAFIDGTTSWSAESRTVSFKQWKLPEANDIDKGTS